MNPPTKEELKAKYDITNDDFEVLTELPSESVIREKGFLVKLGETFGVQEWMWKTWGGIIIAIFVFFPQLKGALDYWTPKATYTSQQFYDYFQHLEFPLPADNHDWIAFTPDAAPPPSGAQLPPLSSFPVGTGVFPASGHAPFA
jgi:hypothetical protein